MTDRYWVGGTGTWDGTAGTKWATTSGGAGGASVPTAADDVFFDAASGAVTVTVATAQAFCRNLNFTGFTGTFAGTTTSNLAGSLLITSGVTFTYSGQINFTATSGAYTITTSGKTISTIGIGSSGTSTASWTLQDALISSGTVTVTSGTFTTNNFNVTATSLSSSNTFTRTINLGSSTVTLTTDVLFNIATNLTFNAGTSTITATANSVNINVGSPGVTFYNYTRSNTVQSGTFSISGTNTFNNLTIAAPSTSAIGNVALAANQIVNGTLTFSTSANATMRRFLRSDILGTTRTLTCATVASLTDIDFRDITIAGAAAPVSGTRLGDCKGNSGITFDAAKTVYWRPNAGSNWSLDTGWAFTLGGTASVTAFPLAQDTAVFPSASPVSGNTITINAAYNIGTIDMSARTSNTMTLATGTTTPAIYGNWINGTGTSLTGTGAMTFAGRGSQTITSAGITFTQGITIDTPSGSVTLQDAFTSNRSFVGAFTLNNGTFNANNYNFSLTGTVATVLSNASNARTLAIGSGTWTIAGSGTSWNTVTSTNLTVTGTGTISLTSTSAKTFAGGGIQTYPTLNQGGVGALTISGSNGFRSMTNTAIGSVLFTGGTTNTFSVSFSLNGALANLLTLGSTNTTQAILKKPTNWLMGLTSVDAGNNTGLTFLSSDGTMSYVSVSYINGQLSALPYMGNFFAFF